MPTYTCKCGDEFEGSEYSLCKDCPDCERAATPPPQYRHFTDLEGRTWVEPVRPEPEPRRWQEWHPWDAGADPIANTITVQAPQRFQQQAAVAQQVLNAQANAFQTQARTANYARGYGMGENLLNNLLGGTIGGTTATNRDFAGEEHEEPAF